MPSGIADGSAEHRARSGRLGSDQHPLLQRRQILREVFGDPFWSQDQKTVLDRSDFRGHGWRREVLGGTADRFAGVRTKGRDIHQAGHFRIIAGLADNGTTV